MNVFFIPSWYPSINNPLPGIFFKDQAIAMAHHFPDLNIGISTWGQNDDRLLLWSRQTANSLIKLLKSKPKKSIYALHENLTEYFSPAYTWTSRVLQGNMKNIIDVNHKNLAAYERAYGKADLIHAHVGYPAGFLAKKLAKIHDIPYIITEQMSPFPHPQFIDKKGKIDKQLQMAYHSSSKNIAISNSLAYKMKDADVPEVIVIPNLVNDLFFTPGPQQGQTDRFTFFSLGRMVPQKGIDILLHAFALLEDDALLKIGGDGEFRNIYQRLAKSLDIADKVQWLGELDINGAHTEYQNCHAFVLSSRHETMGVVFAEAMACGKPVIGTICGGPEEFINESNGLLVPTENATALAGGMKTMMENYRSYDPDKIRTMAENRFSSKVICRQIRNVYEQVIDA